MPSLDHESLVLFFRNQPELAARLLREALHLELPVYTAARLASSDLTEVVPTEFRADAVVLLVGDKPVLGVIVEVQLSRADRKRFTCKELETLARWHRRAVTIVSVAERFE